MRHRTVLTPAVLLSAALLAGAAAPFQTTENPAAPAAMERDPMRMTDLSFLAGAWRMTREDGSVCEETWSADDGAESGASMMGMFRWIAPGERGGASRFVEIMTLREEAVGGEPTIVYRLRHFGMDLKPWEETPIVLHVAEAGDDRVVMRPPEGAGGDVVSIEYRLEGGDLVCDAEFDRGGERDELGFVFERIE